MAEKLTEAQRRFLIALRDFAPLRPADREEDRARQACRRRGLAEVQRRPRVWIITESGRRALEESRDEG